MMKIGLHLSMLCKTWKDDVSPYLEVLKDTGFDGVEISLYGASQEALHKSYKKANALGLDIFCGSGVDEAHDPSSEHEEVRQQALVYLKQCIDATKQAQGKELHGVLYAPWQAFSTLNQKQRWDNSAQILCSAADYAKEHGIMLMIEVINRFESDFMNTLKQGSEFIHLVNHENVKLLVDTFHMNIEEDNIIDALTQYIDVIGSIHVCENHRGIPGSGHFHWKEFLHCLKTIGYNGYLIMETFSESGSEVAKGMSIYRDITNQEPILDAMKGYQFLKACLEEEERS